LPSTLCCKKRKRRRRRQQRCHCLLRCIPAKESEERDGSVVAVAFYTAIKKKENPSLLPYAGTKQKEGDGINTAGAFCARTKKEKKATVALLPLPSTLQEEEEEEGDGSKAAITF
jgi:hypothetical protein